MRAFRFTTVFLVLLMLLPVIGCAQEEISPLHVYYAGENRLFRESLTAFQQASSENVLNVTVFPSDTDMEARLSVELLSGMGPDVILLDLGSTLDFQKLAYNGSFYDLSTYFAQDTSFSPTQYFMPVLEAGKMDGCTYAAPFSFTLPHFITSRERLALMGAEHADTMTFQEILTVLSDRGKAIVGQDAALMSAMTRRTDFAYSLYEASVGSLYDASGDMTQMDESALREISALVRTFYDGIPQLQAVTKRYRNDFVNAVGRIDFLLEDYQLPVNLRYYDVYYGTGLKESLVAIPIPAFDQAGVYRAQVTEYGVIPVQTKQAENAYRLLRFIMDHQTGGVFFRSMVQDALDIPVRRDAAQAAVDAAMSGTGGYAMLSGKRHPISALQPAFGMQINAWYDAIDDAFIPNRKIGNIVSEMMDPYYLGTSDYDTCYGMLTNALWIYMSE